MSEQAFPANRHVEIPLLALQVFYSLADRRTGIESLSLLAGLAALGLAPLLWL